MTTPVTDIDLVKLRMVALGDDKRSLDQNITDFRTMITPQAVLALLDRLERAEKEVERCQVAVGEHYKRVRAAEARATKAEAALVEAEYKGAAGGMEAAARMVSREADRYKTPSEVGEDFDCWSNRKTFVIGILEGVAIAIRRRAQFKQEKA